MQPLHYAVRWRSLGAAIQSLASNPLLSTGMTFGALAILLCVGPLLFGAKPALPDVRRMWRLLAYFAGIGCGFMLIEMGVLLKMQLSLGKPVLALIVALFAFLLASGIGSQLTRFIPDASLARAAATAAVLVVAYGLLLRGLWPQLFDATLSLPTAARALIAIAVIAPLALCMGTLFPLGVRMIGDGAGGFLPWAWATNGCFSVFGIFSSHITGLFFGFDRALLFGFALYLLTAACALAHARSRAGVTGMMRAA